MRMLRKDHPIFQEGPRLVGVRRFRPEEEGEPPTLVLACPRAPANTRDWPKVVVPPGKELVFKPYGPQGAGFYLVDLEVR